MFWIGNEPNEAFLATFKFTLATDNWSSSRFGKTFDANIASSHGLDE
jgi:hypothetical protein